MPAISVLGVPHTYELTAPTDSQTTLVFVHGWMLSREYWRPLVDRLAQDYQCLTYDLRGFGQSQPCQTRDISQHPPYSLQAYAEDLTGLLDQLGIHKAWLVGHSLGGSIALWGAQAMPDRVEGVICVNAGGGIYLKEEFERFRQAGQQMVRFRPGWLHYIPGLDRVFAQAMVTQKLAVHWGQQRIVDFLAADAEAAQGSLLDSTTQAEVHRLPQVVARLRQPVYFIAGANDRIMELKYVRHLASFHSLFQEWGANVFEIPHCGHLAMVEQPDLVVQQFREILAGVCVQV
ncbi:alpha/beta fold hydrolase [Alkalinema pantanalense CENA528]|uniref:alpha/beta fold hydrolase n=1 Tax=Alkalinema pantanalense TaxID=1620705 RepID=UPI003D6F48C5